MKTSNKYIVLAAMALTFAACTQEDDFTPQTDGDAVKINAIIGRLQTRVAYEDDGATNFINGDEICVQNILRDTKNIATYTFDGSIWTTTDALVWNGGTAESQFQAWYPATASFDKFTLPTDQNSIEELPAADWMTASTSAMVKPADKTINLAFEHKLAKITVQITEFTSQFGDEPRLMAATIYSLSDEYVTVNGGIKPVLGGNAAIAIVCPGKYAAGTNLMEVTISDDGRQTNLNVPVNAFLTNTGLEAGKHYTFSLKVGKDAISITKVNVEPWTTKEIDGGMAEEVEPAPFSVSDDNQVLFSPGNLQYHPKNDIWQFAASQTSYIGDANSNTTSDYDGWIDLFGWSGSEGNAEFGVSSSTDYADYSGDFVDWGTNSIGNYTASTWRTLTHSEWRYLFMERTNASELQGAAQVNGVNGVIILPDSWVCPNGVTFKSGYHSEYSEEAFALYQAFTSAEWSLLETHGAVFLPAAGYRPSPTTSSVQKLGNYWSANASSSENAYVVNTYSNKTLFNLIPRYEACSVRLVKDFCKE